MHIKLNFVKAAGNEILKTSRLIYSIYCHAMRSQINFGFKGLRILAVNFTYYMTRFWKTVPSHT